MGDQGKSYRDVVDRRRFIQLTGAAGAVTLAGCLGGGDDGGDGGDGGTTQHISRANRVPETRQWNPSNPSGAPTISHYALFDPFAKYNFATREIQPYAISDWTFSGNSLELKVRDGLTWANGDKVTSSDIATQLRIGKYMGLTYASYTGSIETPDEKTVMVNFDSKTNEKIIEFNMLVGTRVQQKDSVFGKYVEQMKKNEKKGKQELTKFKWTEPIASGPFAFESAGQQQMILETRDDHPDSDKINFDEYVFQYIEGNQASYRALINSNVDSVFSLFTPPKMVKTFPDSVKQFQIPSNWGHGLIPNHNHEHVGDRAVRQAIQYVINRKEVVKNVAKTAKMTPKFAVGLETKNQEKWLGKAASDFNTYGASSAKTKKATKVLEKAGYSKEGGTWKDSNGKTVKLPIIVPSGWSDWVTATETIIDQLSSFGFDSVLDGRKAGTLRNSVWPTGKFTLAVGPWLPGGPSGAHPYFSLYHQLLRNGWAMFKYNYPAAIEKYGGSRKDITVPSRTGSGKLTTNPYERMNDFATATKKSEREKIAVEQAWVTNQDLPMITVMEKFEQTFMTDGDEWDIPKPDADAAQVRWANTWLPRIGKMKYTG